MSQTREVHSDYKNLDELLENLNVWKSPNKVEEATTRRYIESEIIEHAFSETGDVKYGRKVNQDDITPKVFQATEKVEVERVETEDKGDSYEIRAKISSLDPDDKVTLFFEGQVSEYEGLEETKPTIIRRT